MDPVRLAGLSADFLGRTAALEKEIFALAGREFAIASPKQLAQARPPPCPLRSHMHLAQAAFPACVPTAATASAQRFAAAHVRSGAAVQGPPEWRRDIA